MAISPSPSRCGSPSPASPPKQAAGRHDIRRAVNLWLGEGKAQGNSAKTFVQRQTTMARFCWWIETELGEPPTLDRLEPITIREFLIYLREPRPEGRWGTDHPNAKRDVRPSTVATYHAILRAFAGFCLAEGLLSGEPLRNVKTPKVPRDQVQPFSLEQVEALLGAASRKSPAPERDVAIIYVLVDTGLRVSELVALNIGDWRHDAAKLSVVGKGNKRRTVCMETNARRALWRYLEHRTMMARMPGLPEDDPLFSAGKGRYAGERLTPNGIHNAIQRAGRWAGIEGVRCSPHTLRHTFAVNFLRGGGNIMELQTLMGHECLSVLRRYVALAECDVEEAHRKASPGNRVKPR